MSAETGDPKTMLQPKTSLHYMWQLDTIRAIAVGMVIISHWASGRETFWWNGHVGVQLFFVISGFLITGILLDARQKAEGLGIPRGIVIRRFYIRRVLRIFPLFYATLALTYVVGVAAVRDSIQWHIPYLSNVLFALRGDWLGEVAHFWSLAVEEQFYALWPWLILFAPQSWLLPIIAACMISAPIFRYVAGQVMGINEIAVMVMPFASLDTLGIGALFALIQRMKDHPGAPGTLAPKLARLIGVVGVSVFTICHLIPREFGMHRLLEMSGDAMLAPAALGIVFTAGQGIHGPIGRVLAWGPLAYLGKLSYGLYVLHFFVPLMTASMFRWIGISTQEYLGPAGFFLLNGFVLIALSSLSWHCFEKPINALKKYFPYVPRIVAARR